MKSNYISNRHSIYRITQHKIPKVVMHKAREQLNFNDQSLLLVLLIIH